MCVKLTGPSDDIVKRDFWAGCICWGCIGKRLASEWVDWVKKMALPNVGGHQPSMKAWLNKRSRGIEFNHFAWLNWGLNLLLPSVSLDLRLNWAAKTRTEIYTTDVLVLRPSNYTSSFMPHLWLECRKSQSSSIGSISLKNYTTGSLIIGFLGITLCSCICYCKRSDKILKKINYCNNAGKQWWCLCPMCWLNPS